MGIFGMKPMEIGKRDTRITVRTPQPDSSGNFYDDDGKLIAATTTDTEFWGDVEDLKDSGGDLAYPAGKRLDARTIKIIADSRSVENVNILDTLVLDNSTDVFEVIDKHDSVFRFTTVLICKYKN